MAGLGLGLVEVDRNNCLGSHPSRSCCRLEERKQLGMKQVVIDSGLLYCCFDAQYGSDRFMCSEP